MQVPSPGECERGQLSPGERQRSGPTQTVVCDRPPPSLTPTDVSPGQNPPEPTTQSTPRNPALSAVPIGSGGRGHKIGYARVSTADQNPQAQLDALAAEGCLKVYVDHASGTKADRPKWQACLDDLRPGDTLIVWKIDRLGRNLRDLIDIVTTLQQRKVGVRSLTNGIVDNTTAHGKLVFGMFALMAEYEAALVQERTRARLAARQGKGAYRRAANPR
ncbi:recombinase family protein [Nocardia sp. NPDC049220]|uniref:recombinase family protein n=1 Tax=Nocardia sp. NPDC049220 TaxID=3155273 RepID=UPI0033ECDB01